MGLTAVLLIAGSLTGVLGGAASASTVRTVASPSFLVGHPYRHGAVPMRGWLAAHASPRIHALAGNLTYDGGVAGVGVTTGAEKVYLVFWGSQWGTQGVNGQGYATFSGDASGVAPDLQAFFKGLGTGGETWSGVMTQYCEGVAPGTQSCGSSGSHVGYPTGGALAGVWEDSSALSPAQATGNQIGTEAVLAATHFGNTTQASNRNTQYVVVSPAGTNPDGYKQNGFCAWHDYTGDSSLSGGAVSSPDGALAFTNLPYIPDAGVNCGADYVNSGAAGALDGVTIVEGHEYAETITDQFPAGGWLDGSGNETGDKCAWDTAGPDPSQNIALTTGTFAVQPTWANDYNSGAGGCLVAHSIFGGNTVTVTALGSQSSIVGSSVKLQVKAADSDGAQKLTYGATGLPAGLSISSSTGLISGTPKAIGTALSVTVKATDTTAASGATTFAWAITSNAGIGIENGSFETASLVGWARSGPATGVTKSAPHSGSYAALLGSSARTNGSSSIAQSFKVPAGKSKLHVWYNVSCNDTVVHDWATATLKDLTKGTTVTVLAKTCVKSSGWRQLVAAVIGGHSYALTLTNHDDNRPGNVTSTKYDDVALT